MTGQDFYERAVLAVLPEAARAAAGKGPTAVAEEAMAQAAALCEAMGVSPADAPVGRGRKPPRKPKTTKL